MNYSTQATKVGKGCTHLSNPTSTLLGVARRMRLSSHTRRAMTSTVSRLLKAAYHGKERGSVMVVCDWSRAGLKQGHDVHGLEVVEGCNVARWQGEAVWWQFVI